MTQKAAFNAEEWSTVVNAPAITALLMIAASKGGTVRETVAIGKAYQSVREQHPGELMRAVLASPPGIDRASAPQSPEELRRAAPAQLRQALAILDRLATPEEVVDYKRFVYAVADTVARAHKEGGFLGIGGTQVSEHEQAALDEIAALFDAPPPSSRPEEE